jgi:subtilisin family serine protease
METKEYIVILQDGIDYNQVWGDIENPSSGLPHIPDRAVTIVNNRDVQPRMCHYALTDDEAELVKNDPRVLAVERPYTQEGPIPVSPTTFGPSTANVSFTIPAYNNASENNINWSLIRHSYSTNQYGNTANTSSEYNYVLDGTGVDVVIMDTGIEYYHPEFQDANGNTRIVQYNWTGNLNTSPNSINFRDTNGHGTAAASLTAGKNYGWARNSTIYPCKIDTGGTGSISFDTACDAIAAWHRAKNTPGNPAYTGRPTVALGEITYLWPKEQLSITSINYRNTGNVAANAPDVTKGMSTITDSLEVYDLPSNTTLNYSSQGQTRRLAQVDVAVDNMISAGVIFVTAAGNQGVKIAAPTVSPPTSPSEDNDYWNYWNGTWNGFSIPLSQRYYNRGPSPCTGNSIVTGAMAVGLNSSSKNYKIAFSNAGYNVSVFAPGWDVRSALSNTYDTNVYFAASYFLNGSFKQTNFTGTSAACPQIAGIAALYCQAHPTATQAQVKSWLIANANASIMYSTGQSDDYTNYPSQWGGNAGVAFQSMQGLQQIKNNSGSWQSVKNVQYKDPGTGQWGNVQAIYNKTSSGWTQVF